MQREHLIDTPCTGQVQSRGMSSCQIPPLSVFVLTDHSFQQRTALAFLGVYLDSLDEESQLNDDIIMGRTSVKQRDSYLEAGDEEDYKYTTEILYKYKIERGITNIGDIITDVT
jgi:hypothetical protein